VETVSNALSPLIALWSRDLRVIHHEAILQYRYDRSAYCSAHPHLDSPGQAYDFCLCAWWRFACSSERGICVLCQPAKNHDEALSLFLLHPKTTWAKKPPSRHPSGREGATSFRSTGIKSVRLPMVHGERARLPDVEKWAVNNQQHCFPLWFSITFVNTRRRVVFCQRLGVNVLMWALLSRTRSKVIRYASRDTTPAPFFLFNLGRVWIVRLRSVALTNS